MTYSKDETVHNITSDLNKVLEKMVLKNPEQWIWSHDRWKV
jgi:KDO2-lipid IV(A) lauroyltransferase